MEPISFVYAIENGIIRNNDFDDYSRNATREEAAYILSGALPAEEVSGTNAITVILDMTPGSKCYASVYQFAQAGIISWPEAAGSFRPDDPITRAEIAVIVSRLIYPAKRALNG